MLQMEGSRELQAAAHSGIPEPRRGTPTGSVWDPLPLRPAAHGQCGALEKFMTESGGK